MGSPVQGGPASATTVGLARNTAAGAASSNSRLVQVAKTIAYLVAAVFSAGLLALSVFAEIVTLGTLFEGELLGGALVLLKASIDAIGDVWDESRPQAQNQTGGLKCEVTKIE